MCSQFYTVRLTTDKAELHAFLQRDPIYGAYAIGDLEDVHFSQCTWYLAESAGQGKALMLIYQGLEPPVLFCMGDVAGIAEIFRRGMLPGTMYMSAQVEHLPIFQQRYDFRLDRVRPMWRMTVTPERFLPVDAPIGANRTWKLRCLGISDVEALVTLYSAGGAFVPDAFSPSQVPEGVFVGLEHAGELLAVAGTHLVAPTWAVAAVGNLYTHPAWRGRGFGQLVTTAVTRELLSRGMLVVLNVDGDNAAAIRVYQKLGYQSYCPFFEGIGVEKTCDQVARYGLVVDKK
ncbi:MAG: GNAT family N-acetyltransferase [Chloroflexota bacterium]|nr:GNAT family N-acetyltransferase [Chloroflexota bacterium]